MSAKLKIFLVSTLSIFATTVVAGVYRVRQLYSRKLSTLTISKEQQPVRANEISNRKLVVSPYKGQFQTIPLSRFKTILKGTDPAALAVRALNTTQLDKVIGRKVEVVYPQPDRAMVTITQTNFTSSQPKPIKYRVELTSFGRSLFVTSPPLWRIVWAGSSEQCLTDGTTAIAGATCR